MNFSERIITWYYKNKRLLPWRKNSDPYKIWLSEIILQQTRVDQGLPYFKKFIAEFPEIEMLAKASEDDVLKLWQGLGYYSRARNMLLTAKYIVREFNGVFPKKYETILKLKGIGPYTAAAICSFAYNLPYAVVDGNVIRVISRYFGIQTPFNSQDGKKEFQLLAKELLIKEQARDNNQGIMEFGALQCKPRSPNCNICPLQDDCFAFNNNLVLDLPKKNKKLKIRNRYFNFLIINENKKMLIQKREKGIWKGLYQFPLIENSVKKSERTIKNSKKWRAIFNSSAKILRVSPTMKHQLTHQNIFARFWHIDAKNYKSQNSKYINKKELKNYPIPRLLEKYLENIGMI